MPSTATKPTKGPRMSNEAVKAKTGKTWKDWFTIIDKAGGKKLTHQQIVKLLTTDYGVEPWWRQMMAATYEQQRGLRDVHQKPMGYEITVSRTIGVSLAKAYKTIATAKSRNAWLAEEGLLVRKATANKSLRLTWKDGKSSLEIAFLAKGEDKSQVVVQHSKLPSAKDAGQMKTYWAKALDRLRQSLE